MQKTKSRPVSRSKSVSASRALSLAIRCGANLLPVKGLLYAMAHAKASRHVSGSSKKGTGESLRKLSRQIRELAEVATQLQKMEDMGGSELYKAIKLAVIAYVDLFYELTTKERDLFLSSCAGRHGKKISNEQNLLLIPAIMASRGEPKDEVTSFLIRAIYKIPFRVLYHSSKAAVHLELMQHAMGIKAAPEGPVKRFSDALARLAIVTQSIENGEPRPEYDEQLKENFVDEAVLLSQTTDMKVADFISEKIMPNAFTDRMARKIIRKL